MFLLRARTVTSLFQSQDGKIEASSVVDAIVHDKILLLRAANSIPGHWSPGRQFRDKYGNSTPPLQLVHEGVSVSAILDTLHYALAMPRGSRLKVDLDAAVTKLMNGHIVYRWGPKG